MRSFTVPSPKRHQSFIDAAYSGANFA